MISVITASLPERGAMLAECVASVGAQTLQPAEHLISIDHARRGPAEVRSRLLSGVGGNWLAIVDDDDLLLPRHLEALYAASAHADIVYSYCEVEGRAWTPNREFDREALQRGNFIPITTLIRTDLVRDLHGWRDRVANGWEDWDFWLRALDVGARFVCVPEITWRYRFHGANRSQVPA